MKYLSFALLLYCGVVYADCTINIVNKSLHPVTVSGVVVSESGVENMPNWVTVEPNSKAQQFISDLEYCNLTYKYSDKTALVVKLKNNTGSWEGYKGFLYNNDASYANIPSAATADDNRPITLSNGLEINANVFNARICDSSITSDQCN